MCESLRHVSEKEQAMPVSLPVLYSLKGEAGRALPTQPSNLLVESSTKPSLSLSLLLLQPWKESLENLLSKNHEEHPGRQAGYSVSAPPLHLF